MNLHLLPDDFVSRMRALLGAEAGEFFAALEHGSPSRSLHVNVRKIDAAGFAALFESTYPQLWLEAIPWSRGGFYIRGEAVDDFKPSRCALHHAGLYYMQEAAAQAAVEALDVMPGQRVLDLCAAPGGKTSQIADRLGGDGILVTNDIIPSRANILLSNIERMGVCNAVVTCMPPEPLCGRFDGYFDRVLVDSPCSGESMFRREPEAIGEWSTDAVELCAARSLKILDSAAQALRPGGVMVYSTCTWAPEEDEGVVSGFLRVHPEFELLPLELPGSAPGLTENCARFYPHKCDGEGQFIAKLMKTETVDGGQGRYAYKFAPYRDVPMRELAAQFNIDAAYLAGYVPQRVGDAVLLLPQEMPDTQGVRVLRAGVRFAELSQRYSKPCHAASHALDIAAYRNVIDLPLMSDELTSYLHGEQLTAPEGVRDGWCAVSAAGHVLGFGKCAGGAVKNHYPAGLRV